MLANQFGSFDASGRVYTITDPGTPMPWSNVVCNGRYGFVVTQNGGGFSWLDNSQLNVLTRWEMDLVRDVWGKHLFVSDLDSGEVWSLAPSPCRPAYTRYACSHEPGVTTFETEVHGIGARWVMSVAPDQPAEVWTVQLTNRSNRARRLRVASFFEWCCGVAPDAKREFHRLFFSVRHDPRLCAIIATKNMWDIPSKDEKKHWNQPWPYAAGHAIHCDRLENAFAIGDKRAFLGRYGQLHRPGAMTGTLPPTESRGFAGHGRFGDASAALGGDLRLQAGDTVEIVFVLAVEETDAKVGALLDEFRKPASAANAVAQTRDFWSEMLGGSSVQSDAPDFTLLNSTWLAYQAISGRLWARTGVYQQSGAFGFRDQLQDSQVFLARDPARTRRQILLHAAHQFADGSVYHWWHPLAEFGLRTLCSDDYLWLAFLTSNYIKDTGDWSILKERAPFVDDPTGATLADHCRRAIARSLSRFSPRGLPLIGSCDWNDGLSALGVDGKGESVWLAQFLAQILEDFAVVLEHEGDRATAAGYREQRERVVRAIEQHAWDGAWYRAATGDDGRWLGTHTNAEGRIFLNTQTWGILAGTSPPERAERSWRSVKEHLLRDMGPLLSAPAYTQPDAGIGYITRYAPGLRENGGVYMHAATWALAAACAVKDVESVGRIWKSISPPLRCRDGERYHAEPYVTPGNVDGPDSLTPGRAGWTWYTGSAAWLNRVSLEWVCGVRAVWGEEARGGLLIDPCPPSDLGQVEVTRQWRGKSIRVRFDAKNYHPGATVRLSLNGRPLAGQIVTESDLAGAGEAVIEATFVPGVQVKAAHSNGVAGGKHAVTHRSNQ